MRRNNSSSRSQLLRNQAWNARVTHNQIDAITSDTVNRIIGDELLMQQPTRALASEYIGFLVGRNEADVQIEELIEDPSTNRQPTTKSLGSFRFVASSDLIGKYQHPDPDAPDWPEGLYSNMAEDAARHTVGLVNTHIAEAYNSRYGSLPIAPGGE